MIHKSKVYAINAINAINTIEENEATIQRLSETIISILDGVDRISVIPNVLANVFMSVEPHNMDGDSTDPGFYNLMMKWGIETYVYKKLKLMIPKLEMLYTYCVDNKFTMENQKTNEFNNRAICYIPSSNDKRVIYIDNSDHKFVCVITTGSLKLPTVHIRQVFDDITSEEVKNRCYSSGIANTYYDGIGELREALKGEYGLETALLLDRSGYRNISDCVLDNKFPHFISLKNMIQHNFTNNCRAFAYGDDRDAGYLMTFLWFGNKVEIRNFDLASRCFDEIISGIFEIEESYVLEYERKKKINEILSDDQI